jgi:hypothetical protein
MAEEFEFSPIDDQHWQSAAKAMANADPHVFGRIRAEVVREAVDAIARTSGHFKGVGCARLTASAFREQHGRAVAMARAIDDFLPALRSFLGDPDPGGGADDMDMHARFRGMEPLLADLRLTAARAAALANELGSYMHDEQNASDEPHLYDWAFWLIELWAACGLPRENKAPLQDFLCACLGAYKGTKIAGHDVRRRPKYLIALCLTGRHKPSGRNYGLTFGKHLDKLSRI